MLFPGKDGDKDGKKEDTDGDRDFRDLCITNMLERILLGLESKCIQDMTMHSLTLVGTRQVSESLGPSLSQILAKLCEMLPRQQDSYTTVQMMRCISILLTHQVRQCSWKGVIRLIAA